jgi:hypothetical protein
MEEGLAAFQDAGVLAVAASDADAVGEHAARLLHI